MYEMFDETLRTHTVARTKEEFSKDFRDQDPYFGPQRIADALIESSNKIRFIGEFLSFDEEIVSQLGRMVGAAYCPDKNNKRGLKVFSMNGCNHISMEDNAVKGYYFWFYFYRGKSRHPGGAFSVYGLGFDMICQAVIFLGLR